VNFGTDLRTRTVLVCGAMALAVAAATLLRGRVRRAQLFFSAFAAAMGLWYLTQSAYGFFRADIWQRFTAMLAVLLPQFALHLFEAMVPHEVGTRPRLLRVAHALAVPALALVLSPEHASRPARIAVFVYVFTLVISGLVTLGQRGKRSPSRATQRRVRLVVLTGSLAGLASIVDFAWFIDVPLPPVAAAASVVFLFVLSQAVSQERVLDAYEMLGRLFVATALASLLAAIFYALISMSGGFNTIYLSAVLAAIVILLVFDPLRQRVEEQIQRLLFRERFELETAVAGARARLAHTLEIAELGSIVTEALERSRRLTSAGLYIRDPEGSGFDRVASLAERVPERLDASTARALLDRLERGAVSLEELDRETRDRRARGEPVGDAELSVLASAEVLGPLARGFAFGVFGERRELVGVLVVVDDRVRDAFSPEDVAVLTGLAQQVGVVIENSNHYAQLKERDRLAMIGQMAAGLAHEIRNPLGAIKGAAQLLSDPPADEGEAAASNEFLGIILEEVDRLDRVVGSVLDLARPSSSSVVPVDVNAVVRRTLQVLSAERSSEELVVEVVLDPSLPRVAIDAEQLRQVVMNLFRNAAQAMRGRGRITVSSRVRFGRGTRPGVRQKKGEAEETWVELTVADNGPGMSKTMLEKIFLPFFTTREKGTGLGLAISQRIAQAAGGRLEVRSYEGKGSAFTMIVPAAPEPASTPTPSPASAPPAR
jgi:two-component system sensor histidine kinase HydH